MPSEDLSEKETRNQVIDPQLKRVGWTKQQYKEEVNPVKSDIKNGQYALFSGSHEKNVDLFIDYLLLSDDYSPLALIEAKKYSKDPQQGRIQARTYVKEIEKQVGYPIQIFLTNGQEWRLIDQIGVERKISGPFSQEDLKRRHQLFISRSRPDRINIRKDIIDRDRNLTIVKLLSEHFAAQHRSALVTMATGTGKTRVAMAIIDVLLNANYVRNILFVADRIALANQAKTDGFQRFFTEPIGDLRDEIKHTSRLYVTTVQTLAGGGRTKKYEMFSPGFFDLIIFDEAHRSIYDKNNIILGYFDTIKMGLTATPKDTDAKNTYDLFGCDFRKPTAEYTYDQAVSDGVLVRDRSKSVETKVLTLGIKGEELSDDLKDQLRRQEENPETTDFHGSEFDHVFMDDKTNELVIQTFMQECYKSDEGLPAKSVFFCASQRHAKHMKKVFDRLFPHLSGNVQVITSDMHRAEDEVRRFKNSSEPRIALSVGMLDTGIDVPEICNLVFVKPIYSGIRFWQMFGRGTRNLKTCRHPEWLPEREKNDFLLLDFKIGGHSNLEAHKIPISKEARRMDVMTRIFVNRVKLLNRDMGKKEKALIIRKIMDDIETLNKDSFIVREKLSVIKKLESDKFNLEKYIEELNKEIAPLMMLKPGTNSYVSSFILNAEKLFGLALDGKRDIIETMRSETLVPMMENVARRTSLSEVKDHLPSLKKALQESFWDDLTFEKVEFLITEIAPLMKYYSPEPGRIIQVDALDIITDIKEFEREIKVNDEMKKLIDENPLIRKLKDGGSLTATELLELVEVFHKIRPEITIPNIQQSYKKDFLIFLTETIGVSRKYDPRVLIERQFDDYVIKNSQYNSQQLDFLRLLKKVFVEQKSLKIEDFGRPPLSDQRPLDLFEMAQIEMIVKNANKIRFS